RFRSGPTGTPRRPQRPDLNPVPVLLTGALRGPAPHGEPPRPPIGRCTFACYRWEGDVGVVGEPTGRCVVPPEITPALGWESVPVPLVSSGAGLDRARMLPLGSTSPATTAARTKIADEYRNAVV